MAKANRADEIQQKLESLSPESFEDMTVKLLNRVGFKSIKRYGSSGDGGIDILCERWDTFGPQLVNRKVAVQCKRFRGPIDPQRLESGISKAEQRFPDCYLLVTTTVTNARFKTWYFGLKETRRSNMHFLLWERLDLELLLANHQDIRAEYLTIPVDSTYLTIRNLLEVNPSLIRLEGSVFTKLATDIMCDAVSTAIKNRSNTTTANIFTSGLQTTGSIFQEVFEKTGYNCRDLALSFSHFVLPNQKRQQYDALQLTPSACRVLDNARNASASFHEGGIGDAGLLYAILYDENSATTEALGMLSGKPTNFERLRSLIQESALRRSRFQEKENRDLMLNSAQSTNRINATLEVEENRRVTRALNLYELIDAALESKDIALTRCDLAPTTGRDFARAVVAKQFSLLVLFRRLKSLNFHKDRIVIEIAQSDEPEITSLLMGENGKALAESAAELLDTHVSIELRLKM